MLTTALCAIALRRSLLASVLALVLAIGGTPARAETDLIDPHAAQLLRQMSQALGGAETLSFKAYSLFDEIEPSGVKIKFGQVQEVTLKRPDRLHFTTERDDGTRREGWYDGKTLTIARDDKKTFSQVAVPGTIDELLDWVQDHNLTHVPLIDLLYSDLYGKIEGDLLSGVYAGERSLEGVPLDHLSFETTPGDVQLWLEKGETPLPRRVVITFVAIEGEPEYIGLIREWSLDRPVDDAAFHFEPPAGWQKVDLPVAAPTVPAR